MKTILGSRLGSRLQRVGDDKVNSLSSFVFSEERSQFALCVLSAFSRFSLVDLSFTVLQSVSLDDDAVFQCGNVKTVDREVSPARCLWDFIRRNPYSGIHGFHIIRRMEATRPDSSRTSRRETSRRGRAKLQDEDKKKGSQSENVFRTMNFRPRRDREAAIVSDPGEPSMRLIVLNLDCFRKQARIEALYFYPPVDPL